MTADRMQEQYKQTSNVRDFDADENLDWEPVRKTESSQSPKGQSPKGRGGDQKANEELAVKFKQTWSLLNDADIALYTSGKKDLFYDTLEEKHGLMREEAQEQIEGLKQSCGCSSKAA